MYLSWPGKPQTLEIIESLKIIRTSQKVLVINTLGWLRPDMTEKLFTGKLSKNESKNHKINVKIYRCNTIGYLIQTLFYDKARIFLFSGSRDILSQASGRRRKLK